MCHDPSPGPLHIVQQPPDSPKTPDALPNFCPCPAPILVSPDATLANSNASPANSNGPLANFDAFPTATDTYPGSPEPRESPPLFLIFATHHQLNTLVPPTHSGVSRQPRVADLTPNVPSAPVTSIQWLPPWTPSPTHTQPPTSRANRQIISHPTLTLSANSVLLHKVGPDVTHCAKACQPHETTENALPQSPPVDPPNH
ncbi:hypothetical protein E4T56_gene4366 [Termitomyces sp. T112]|nr:hypothetical protein E4T56_gene4366 [Termitomyces sp. T112]